MPFVRCKLGGNACGMLFMAYLAGAADLQGAGVTLITHGNTGNTDGWVTGMADALSGRIGGGVPIYRVDVTNGSAGYVAFLKDATNDTPLASSSGEIIVKLDWRTLADTSHSTYSVAIALAPKLTQTNFIPSLGGHALAEFPIHLIGHSRGGSLICELSLRLGEMGIWVDEVTTLDAHPISGDAPVQGYENVMFAESYYESNSLLHLTDGITIPNAHWRRQTNADGGYEFPYNWHSDVHLWYHGTIDLETPTTDTETNITITAAMRNSWWHSSEQKGTNAGFVYSRLGGGDRYSTLFPNGTNYSNAIREGVNQNFELGAGVATNRTPLTFNTGEWPNIIKVDLLDSNGVAQGSSADVQIYYQWAQPTNSTMAVEVWRDVDQNPLNGNEQLLHSTNRAGTTSAEVGMGTISASIAASNSPVGAHRLFVRVSTPDRSRVLYAPQLLVVTPSLAPPTLDITPQAGGVLVGVNGSAGQIVVLQISSDLLMWQPVATNTLESARWEVARDPLLESNEFFRAELLEP